MLEITSTGPSSAVVRFVVEDVAAYGRVSVVGSFNAWTPGAHELTPDADGIGSVSVEVSTAEDLHFRYLATSGAWFDEVDADAVTEYGSVIVDFRRGAVSSQPDPEASGSRLDEVASTEAQRDANRGSTKAAAAPSDEASAAAALENGPANPASTAHEGAHRPDSLTPTESTAAASSPAPATKADNSKQ